MSADAELERVCAALRALRLPPQRDEAALHGLAAEALTACGIPFVHEARLAPRCRADFLCGGVCVEIKRGPVDRARVRAQLARYAALPEVTALVLLTERTVDLPRTLAGKPVRNLCLNRLWGIAL